MATDCHWLFLFVNAPANECNISLLNVTPRVQQAKATGCQRDFTDCTDFTVYFLSQSVFFFGTQNSQTFASCFALAAIRNANTRLYPTAASEAMQPILCKCMRPKTFVCVGLMQRSIYEQWEPVGSHCSVLVSTLNSSLLTLNSKSDAVYRYHQQQGEQQQQVAEGLLLKKTQR